MIVGIACALVYGALLILGGGLDYAQTGHRTSLVSGIGGGGLLILGAVLWHRGIHGGIGLALGVTVPVMAIFMGRWMKTRQAMPGLMLVLVGMAAFIGMIWSLL